MPKKWLTEEEVRAYLSDKVEGRLATCNNYGQPYITPVNYIYHSNKIYFHCAHKGHKLDNILANPKVCFEVSHTTKNVFGSSACNCSTRYTSVIVFGTATVVEDEEEKVSVLNSLTERFANNQPFTAVDKEKAKSCTVVVIAIDKMTGKKNVDPGEI